MKHNMFIDHYLIMNILYFSFHFHNFQYLRTYDSIFSRFSSSYSGEYDFRFSFFQSIYSSSSGGALSIDSSSSANLYLSSSTFLSCFVDNDINTYGGAIFFLSSTGCLKLIELCAENCSVFGEDNLGLFLYSSINSNGLVFFNYSSISLCGRKNPGKTILYFNYGNCTLNQNNISNNKAHSFSALSFISYLDILTLYCTISNNEADLYSILLFQDGIAGALELSAIINNSQTIFTTGTYKLDTIEDLWLLKCILRDNVNNNELFTLSGSTLTLMDSIYQDFNDPGNIIYFSDTETLVEELSPYLFYSNTCFMKT